MIFSIIIIKTPNKDSEYLLNARKKNYIFSLFNAVTVCKFIQQEYIEKNQLHNVDPFYT